MCTPEVEPSVVVEAGASGVVGTRAGVGADEYGDEDCGGECGVEAAAAYEPEFDVLLRAESVCVWLVAMGIIEGGGAGGSSDRSCSESSGSAMSSIGAETRVGDVGAAALGAADGPGVSGSGSSGGVSRSMIGSNSSGGAMAADGGAARVGASAAAVDP